jgi:hypothetical protein
MAARPEVTGKKTGRRLLNYQALNLGDASRVRPCVRGLPPWR